LKVVTAAQRRLKRHFRSHGGQAAYEASESTASLKTVARRLRKTIPQSEVRRLRRTLREAVQAEQYEQAARLRDQILQRGGRL
jgi:protein-arginine kinase activator protein McsA